MTQPPRWLTHPKLTPAPPGDSAGLWRVEYACPDFGFSLGQIAHRILPWFCGESGGETAEEAILAQLSRHHRSYLDALDAGGGIGARTRRVELSERYAQSVLVLAQLLALAVKENA